MSTTQEESSAESNEALVNNLQRLGMIPGPQQFYVQFFTANAGLATSLSDLVDKIDNETVTRNDYADVFIDLYALGTSVAGFTVLLELGMVSPVGLLILAGIGVGLAVWNYADRHNYNLSEIQADLELKLDNLMNLLGNLAGNIDDIVNDFWNAAQNWAPRPRDPLALDLDGDGIETLGITSTAQVLFDHDGDGVKTATGWISGDDGLLVLDRNGNGTETLNINIRSAA